MGKQRNNYKDLIACHTHPSVVVQALGVEGGALVFPNSFSFKDQQILARAGVQ